MKPIRCVLTLAAGLLIGTALLLSLRFCKNRKEESARAFQNLVLSSSGLPSACFISMRSLSR